MSEQNKIATAPHAPAMKPSAQFAWKIALGLMVGILLLGRCARVYESLFHGASKGVDGFGEIKFGMSIDEIRRMNDMRCADKDAFWSSILPRDGSIDLGFFQQLFLQRQLGNSTVTCVGEVAVFGVKSSISIFMQRSGPLFPETTVSSVEVSIPTYESNSTLENQKTKEAVVRSINPKMTEKYGLPVSLVTEDSFRSFVDQFDPGYSARHGYMERGQVYFYADHQVAVTEELDSGGDVYKVTIAYRSREYAEKLEKELTKMRIREHAEKIKAPSREMSRSL